MAIKFKHPSIKYTSRDFNSIRNDLVEYAKRYYPDSFKDFNEASFGAMMVDSVAYIGDMLSFYLDYQANESFLTTAHEYNNILKHGKAMGYKLDAAPSSYGVVTLFVKVPAAPSGLGPDTAYIPTLRRGTILGSTSGAPFMLINDVNFADPQYLSVAAVINETNGQPTEYAIRAYGEVVSGRLNVQTFKVGEFTKFRRIDLRDPNLTEIISVVDSEGNEYFEVDYLSQNVIYRPVVNTGANSNTVPSLLKPFVAMRRFTVEREFRKNFLQFGYGSEDNLSNEGYLNPDDVIFQRHARTHITDVSYDPTKMIQSDKFGVAPSNTTLTVSYRTNDSTSVNAGAGSIINVRNSIFKFSNTNKLSNVIKTRVANSLEVSNDEPVVGDVTFPTTGEVKRRIFDTFTSQHRAVTTQDYKALVYMMPSKYGAIKRCNIIQDPDAFKRNLNLTVISEDSNGNLTKTNDTIKNNLKNWLNQYRMVNDTIDILDARVVNIGIDFTIVTQSETDKFTILRRAEKALRRRFMSTGDISESLSISDMYRVLNLIPGVSDTIDVTIARKSTPAHSPISFNIEEHLSFDGRYLVAPEDVVFEVRFLDTDIRGTVR